MTDKELIKQEIERLKEENSIGLCEYDAGYCNGVGETCSEILQFIDSLPEESASKDLIEEIDKIWKTCNPIDEGMGVETANIHIEQFDDIARHFAEWQKQQMMKDAVECTWGSYATSAFMSDFPNIDSGDKVKIIIVKTEQ